MVLIQWHIFAVLLQIIIVDWICYPWQVPKLNIGVAKMIVAFGLFSALDNIDLCCIRMSVFQSTINNEGTKVEILLNNFLVSRAYGD